MAYVRGKYVLDHPGQSVGEALRKQLAPKRTDSSITATHKMQGMVSAVRANRTPKGIVERSAHNVGEIVGTFKKGVNRIKSAYQSGVNE